jgi:hypothetical protein
MKSLAFVAGVFGIWRLFKTFKRFKIKPKHCFFEDDKGFEQNEKILDALFIE